MFGVDRSETIFTASENRLARYVQHGCIDEPSHRSREMATNLGHYSKDSVVGNVTIVSQFVELFAFAVVRIGQIVFFSSKLNLVCNTRIAAL